MNCLEITINKAYQENKITWSNAKRLINKAIRAFNVEAYDSVVEEYTELLRQSKTSSKGGPNEQRKL